MDGAKPAVDSFPTGFQLEIPRIYLLLLRDDHIVAIENLKTFFDVHKKFICFSCNQFFSESRGRLHRCFKLDSCFNCTGIFETPKTVKNNSERIFFCDSKLPGKQIEASICLKCNLEFTSQKCFSNHHRLCRSSTAGWRCPSCCIYQLRNGKTTEEIAATHSCSKRQTKCEYCFQFREEQHICQIKKKLSHKIWPNLVFLTMKHKNIGTGNCQNCFEVQRDFMKVNNLSWADMCHQEIMIELVCNKHKNYENTSRPNVICMFKEVKRHVFKEFVFTDDELKIATTDEETFLFNYCENPKEMTYNLPKRRRGSQAVTSCFGEKLSNLKSGEACSKFLRFICQDGTFSNCTFLMDDKALVRNLVTDKLNFMIAY
jgi:hypothetical protein